MSTIPSKYANEFDEEFDVVVVGYGFAGGAAAITAADAGCSVLLAEKMPDPGGISITAGGGLRIADDADKAFAYLKATNDARTPDNILENFAQEMTQIKDWIAELAKPYDGELDFIAREGNYPFPGYETFAFLEVASIPGFETESCYPYIVATTRGPHLFRIVELNVNARENIEVRCGFAAQRLILGPGGEVRGISCTDESGVVRRIKARRGVILACGGFEANPDMQQQYWQIQPVLPAGAKGNTGDGIRMAQDAGADLWHMWHFHGSYGFKHPDPNYRAGIRMKKLPFWTPEHRAPAAKQTWILLDQDGQRYMDEAPPYLQDTGQRHMEFYDSVKMRFPRIPSWIVIDETGRKTYPLGDPIFQDRDASVYEWSRDNLKEVENGMLRKADTIEELAKILDVSVDTVQAQIDTWNHACAEGCDEDFGRHPDSMQPLNDPPYYVGQVWPVISNTQGGPVHDVKQRVLNGYSQAIPRLYEAGELGSIWGSVYLAGGNLSECFITGRIAGNEVAESAPWD